MEQTAIQAGPPPRVTIPAQVPQPRPAPRVFALVRPLASLRLTVWLFVLSILLVLFGTLAQVDAGIWTVVNQYFRSAYVWVPLQIFFPRTVVVSGGFPYPGGWLLGGLLLANLLAAHAIRFKMTWKRSGIFLIHAGLIVMMMSELVTGLMAVESRMVIRDGATVNFLDHSREVELAIVDSSRPGVDDVIVLPESILRKGGRIHHDLLPFDIEVLEYMSNSFLKGATADMANDAVLASDSNYYTVVPMSEAPGVGPDQHDDIPSLRAAFLKKDTSEKLASGVFSAWFYSNLQTSFMDKLRFQPQQVRVGDKNYQVELRFKRTYTPFSIRLIEFRHDLYVGTQTPKNFSSRIELMDPDRKEPREVTVSMNAPLRYEGETFYQASFVPGDRGTVFQVVNNPGWLMPYISCVMVALGMIIHFGLHLVRFLQRSLAS